MKNTYGIIFLAFIFSSCNISPFVFTETATSAPTLTPTATFSPTGTATITPDLTPRWWIDYAAMPTLTPLPPLILEDILEIQDNDISTNQYGWYVQGFNYEITSASDCVHSGQYGLRIEPKPKTVDNKSSFWGVQYQPPLDATKNKNFIFWVKGETGGEIVHAWITVNYGAELGFDSNQYIDIKPSEWQQVKHPLPHSEGFNAFQVTHFSLYLNSTGEMGAVCIDDIAFAP